MDSIGYFPEVILVLAFGYPSNLSANGFLAGEAMRASNGLDVPIFAERDIPISPRFIKRVGGKVFGGDGSEYLSSLKLIRAFAEWVKENYPDRKKILLLAAPPYQRRCSMDLQREMPEVMVLIDKFKSKSHSFWFQKSSAQWWTRYEFAWDFREGIIMFLRKTCWPVYEWIMMR